MIEDGSEVGIYEIDLNHQVYKNKCACEDPKQKYQSFCTRCVMDIPKSIRLNLWFTFEDGFVEVYDDCLKWLMEHSTRYMGVM